MPKRAHAADSPKAVLDAQDVAVGDAIVGQLVDEASHDVVQPRAQPSACHDGSGHLQKRRKQMCDMPSEVKRSSENTAAMERQQAVAGGLS